MKLICTKPNGYIKQGTIHTVQSDSNGCYAIKIKQGIAYIRKDSLRFHCGDPIGIADFAIYREQVA